MNTKEQIKTALVVGLLFAGLIYIASRPNAAEYHHCMVTSTDKTICASLNPKK